MEALPHENLTASEEKQKTQYQAELDTVEKKLRRLDSRPFKGETMPRESAPWVCAESYLNERGHDNVTPSSVSLALLKVNRATE